MQPMSCLMRRQEMMMWLLGMTITLLNFSFSSFLRKIWVTRLSEDEKEKGVGDKC